MLNFSEIDISSHLILHIFSLLVNRQKSSWQIFNFTEFWSFASLCQGVWTDHNAVRRKRESHWWKFEMWNDCVVTLGLWHGKRISEVASTMSAEWWGCILSPILKAHDSFAGFWIRTTNIYWQRSSYANQYREMLLLVFSPLSYW